MATKIGAPESRILLKSDHVVVAFWTNHQLRAYDWSRVPHPGPVTEKYYVGGLSYTAGGQTGL